jgi:hypothetical protein
MENQYEKIYKAIGKVYCPYFKGSIHFTRDGYEHLKFKTKFKARNARDRDMRFRLLPIALQILGDSHTLQNRVLSRRFEDRYVNSRKESALLTVIYYEFMAIIQEKRVKVVIKQVENSEKIFLSVIPMFKQKMPLPESDML